MFKIKYNKYDPKIHHPACIESIKKQNKSNNNKDYMKYIKYKKKYLKLKHNG